ncbi:hypothetical protein GOBAR_DD29292 [Gossypium barbadense]|nr:hypothetical protein GOBAR_DD29292 [Gossypium barbadense]
MAGYNQWPKDPPNFKTRMEEYFRLGTGMPLIFFNLQITYLMINLIGCGLVFGWLDVSRKIVGGISSALGVSRDESEGTLDGEWIPATPIPGTFVCNNGDMLKIWSNGIYEATLYRVINNFPKYRVSVGYFYEKSSPGRFRCGCGATGDVVENR